MKQSLVVFDFDGVLIDSNAVKRDAYFLIFTPAGFPREVIQKVLGKIPGADRFETIRKVLSTQEAPSDARVGEFAQKYNAICESHTITCAEIPGVSQILPELKQTYRLAVNSDTPEDVLQRVIKRRGWDSWFSDIYGRPESKTSNLQRLMNKYELQKNDVVFIGDKQKDWQAAQALHCKFIGMTNEFNDFQGRPDTLISSITELKPILLNEQRIHA